MARVTQSTRTLVPFSRRGGHPTKARERTPQPGSFSNARLGAYRCFFRVVAVCDPAIIAIVNRVLAIPQRARTDASFLPVQRLRKVVQEIFHAAPKSSTISRIELAPCERPLRAWCGSNECGPV